MTYTEEQTNILSAIRSAGQNYIAVKQNSDSTNTQKADAFSRLQSMAEQGRKAGLTITDIAFPAQLSRKTIYDMIGEERAPKNMRVRRTRIQRNAEIGRDE